MTNEKTKIFQTTEGAGSNLPFLHDCEPDDVPEEARDQIKLVANNLESIQTPLRKPNYMDFGDGGKAYVLTYHQTSQYEGYQTRNYAVYSVDIGPDGEYMGIGTSLLELDQDDREKGDPPYVEWTYTRDAYKNRGLATRRLIVLNEANKQFFNHRLSSGSFAEDPAAEKAWQRLTELGLAAQDEHGGYQFIG
ncbi:MAG TPA: hypothetical protein VI336_03295 [Candidatus Saccharimonadales bacterium]|nr:hypothetical protein [Candidatus Saccharimonadales bacterium]